MKAHGIKKKVNCMQTYRMQLFGGREIFKGWRAPVDSKSAESLLVYIV